MIELKSKQFNKLPLIYFVYNFLKVFTGVMHVPDILVWYCIKTSFITRLVPRGYALSIETDIKRES